jgi:hypothetical protein
VTPLIDIATLLLTNDRNLAAVETGKSTHDRSIVRIPTIAVYLDKI